MDSPAVWDPHQLRCFGGRPRGFGGGAKAGGGTVINDAFCLTLTDDGSLHPVAKHSRGAPPRASKAATWKRRPVI